MKTNIILEIEIPLDDEELKHHVHDAVSSLLADKLQSAMRFQTPLLENLHREDINIETILVSDADLDAAFPTKTYDPKQEQDRLDRINVAP